MTTIASSSAIISAANLKANDKNAKAAPAAAAKPVKVEAPKQAVPSLSELNARAFMQRQQIGAALYDRSFTFSEGINALKRQDTIASYAKAAQAKEGGITEKDLKALDRKLDRAEAQIAKLSTNAKGADLDSSEAVDGKELDTVQDNLQARITAGLKDGTLTQKEAEGLQKRFDLISEIEGKLRESDSKLTAGEQKEALDQLRKLADDTNRLRNNNDGVNLTYKTYQDNVDARQASLEKQLEAGIKRGSLTEKEAAQVKESLSKAAELEGELTTDGRMDWRDATKMSTALNDAEIALYDLQRNNKGVKLAESYVDVKYVDQRQAQQLESVARGISNKNLTDQEGVEVLDMQRDIQNLENRYVKDDGKLDRGEYLRLQSAMNDFSLKDNELQTNKDRWTGLVATPAAPAPAPVKPAVSVDPAPVKPEVAVNPVPVMPAPVTPEPIPVKPEPQPVKPEVAAQPAPQPAAEPAKVEVKPEVKEEAKVEAKAEEKPESNAAKAEENEAPVSLPKPRDSDARDELANKMAGLLRE